MHVPTITIFSLVVAAFAKVGKFDARRKLTPEDVGSFHTDAFEQLIEKYSTKRPKNRNDMMMDTSQIISSYCPEGDSICISNANEIAFLEFHLAQKGPREVSYPEDFDLVLKKHIEKMDSTIRLVGKTNIHNIVHSLTVIRDEIQELEGVNEGYKIAALSGLSVAIDSSKLWHVVYSDVDHPLYNMHHTSYLTENDSNRRLQQYPGVTPPDVIGADVKGAISTVVNEIVLDPENFQVFDLLERTFKASISASVAFLSNSTNSTNSTLHF